jgi:hypothetical protein
MPEFQALALKIDEELISKCEAGALGLFDEAEADDILIDEPNLAEFRVIAEDDGEEEQEDAENFPMNQSCTSRKFCQSGRRCSPSTCC